MPEDRSEYRFGERPPEGTYVCMTCMSLNPYMVIVPEQTEKLPICPVCGGIAWQKV